jgi:hypothetical protein
MECETVSGSAGRKTVEGDEHTSSADAGRHAEEAALSGI